MAKEKSSDDRTRNWTAVVYPDSAPENWRDVLDEEHIAWIESPLHEYDTNPDGEVKKAHWHIILVFEGKKSFEQVCSILEPLNCPIPKRVNSMRGAVRYLAHMDNPEKFQYSTADIIGHGGADVKSYLALSDSEKKAVVNDIFAWASESGCMEFCDLVDYAHANQPEWFDVLQNGFTIFFDAYFRSKRGKAKQP